MHVKQLDLEEWGTLLPNDGYEVFHRPEVLSVLDKYATGDLQLFGGFKGEQPVALLPVFVQKRGPGTAILSPEPGMNVRRLGPILMPTSPKRRKYERVNSRFTEQVLDLLEVDHQLTLFRMVCSTAYSDPRPYIWNGLDTESYFTYMLDTENVSSEDLLASFSKSLRREIRDGEELDITVEVGGEDDTRRVYKETETRYREQDKSLSVSWPYVRDLTQALGDRCRTYVARDTNDSFLGGITVLYSNDVAYFWQGGTKTTHENVSINSLIHWRIIEDISEGEPLDSVTRYDLYGANTERLCQYKSKYGAELVPFYAIESSGPGMKIAKRAYQTLSG